MIGGASPVRDERTPPPVFRSMTSFAPLHRDHERLRALFDGFEELGPRRLRERRKLFEELRAELDAHRSLEEDLVYPAAVAAGLASPLADAEGHRIIARLVAELEGIGVEDRRFDPVFAVLRGNVEQHIAEEERDLIPQLEAGLSPAHRQALERALVTKSEELRTSV